MRVLLVLLMLAASSAAFSQSPTGPGGVGNSTTNALWLSSDFGVYSVPNVTLAVDGNNVAQWQDRSGNAKHATSTAPNQPNYETTPALTYNGFPTLVWTAANGDRILSSLGAGVAGNSAHIWIVASRPNAAPLTSTNPGLIHAAPAGQPFGGGAGTKSIGMWVTQNAPNFLWGRGIEADGTSINIPQVSGTAQNTINIFHAAYNGSNFISQFINGTGAGGVAYDGTLQDWREFGIGNQGGESWNGDIAEVIVYNSFLNNTQRIIITNYLASKYGLTIANDFYAMDTPGNGNFDYEVAGIGRVSVAPSDFYSDAQGSGIVRIAFPTDLNSNGEYFFWGHNNLALQATSGDVPPGSGISARFAREWRVSETGEVGNIDIAFDVTGLPDFASLSTCDAATSLRLLIDTNNNGYADASPIAGATNVGGNLYRFAAVGGLNNSFKFTIGIVPSSVSGPGGVGGANGTTNLELWLDAGLGVTTAGTAVTDWADQSGNAINCTAPNAGAQPTFTASTINGRPVITFDGTTDILHLSSNVNTTTPTVFIVANRAAAGGTRRSYLTLQQNTFITRGAATNQWGMFNNVDVLSGTTLGLTHSLLTTVEANFNSVTFYTNENAPTNVVTGTAHTGKALGSVGANNNGAGAPLEFHNGNIAELAVYSTNLSGPQRVIVSNYLAAKYGLTLSNNDIYTQDNAPGHFDFDVAGIGRVGGSTHTDSRGSGIVRISGPSSLDDGDYLIWGHNGGTLIATTTDVPAPVQAKFNRIWALDEAGDVGTLDIQFDLSSQSPVTTSDLRLVIDHDGDGIFDEPGTLIIGSAVAQACSNYLFSDVPAASLADNMRFTIGTINKIQTPLPIVLLSFTGTMNKGAAELSWTTESEHSNDYFSVERSQDGEHFEPIVKVPGAGDSNEKRNYNATDNFPPQGHLYYRLNQVDYSGKSTLSKIIHLVNTHVESKVSVYPNPVKMGTELNVRIAQPGVVNGQTAQFILYDLSGRPVQLEYEQEGDNQFSVKIGAQRAKGVYLLKIQATGLSKVLYHKIYVTE